MHVDSPLAQKKRGLALAALLTEMNSAHHDELGGWGKNEHTAPWCRSTVSSVHDDAR
ncbi:MAG TPA: hypothetical protein VM925_08925 [Labilithrix sp.]|nr:hypothetical protein [Labilithrix sp.]